MAGRPLEHVQRFYERVNRDDPEGAMRCLHPEVEWIVPAETSLEPEVFRGLDHVRHDFERFGSTWSRVGVELYTAHELDDRRVVVDVRWYGVAAVSGVPVEMRLGGLWEVCDGLVTRFEHFPSVDAALAAADAASADG